MNILYETPTVLRLFVPNTLLHQPPAGADAWLVGWVQVHSVQCAGTKHQLISIVVATQLDLATGEQIHMKPTAAEQECLLRQM